MRNPEIVSSSYYHVYNRGVDKRLIFQSDRDFDRFIESLYLFNNTKGVEGGGDGLSRATELASA